MVVRIRAEEASFEERRITLGDGSVLGVATSEARAGFGPGIGPGIGPGFGPGIGPGIGPGSGTRSETEFRNSLPILYIHGLLGSRLEPFIPGRMAARIIAVDRPGYGWSDPLPAPSLKAFGRRIADAADRLGLTELVLFGTSAGGPYAVAAALALGARVRRLVLAGAVGPPELVRAAPLPMRLLRQLDERAWLHRTMVPPLHTLFAHATTCKLLVRGMLQAERKSFADKGELARACRRMSRSILSGVGKGRAGVETDIRILTHDWDIDPRDLTCPANLFHSVEDRIVPVAHAHRYETLIKGSEGRYQQGLGHITGFLAAIGEASGEAQNQGCAKDER